MTAPNLDTLSALGRKMVRLDTPQTYRALVVVSAPMHLDVEILRDLSPRDLLEGPIADENAAACVLAALWLRHDRLDEAHQITQAIDTPEGSYWHAIVHRREGDFSNSKYWLNRAGAMPLFATLAARAAEAINPFPADKSVYRLTGNGWNPSAFVDLVAAVHDRSIDPRHALCVTLQQIEWQVLFEHCRRSASSPPASASPVEP